MSLLRTAVLWIPAIRRLHESRGALLAERDSLIRKIVPPAVEDPNADEVRAAHTEGRLIITEYPYHPRSRPLEASAGGRCKIPAVHQRLGDMQLQGYRAGNGPERDGDQPVERPIGGESTEQVCSRVVVASIR